MEFVSTRGGKGASFEEVLLGGLAPDGGLYLPGEWPAFAAADIRQLASLPYADAAVRVLSPFAEACFSDAELHAEFAAAYTEIGRAHV